MATLRVTQEEWEGIPIRVSSVKNSDDQWLIDHKELRRGLTYRRGSIFIKGLLIPITKLRQWLIQALKDPGTGRAIKDFGQEDWAMIRRVTSVKLANTSYSEGPSLIITLPKRGGLQAQSTFISSSSERYTHEVVLTKE